MNAQRGESYIAKQWVLSYLLSISQGQVMNYVDQSKGQAQRAKTDLNKVSNNINKNYTGLISALQGLLSCHLANTGCPVRQAGFNGVCQLGSQKENVGIQKKFFPWFWLSKLSKIHFLQRQSALVVSSLFILLCFTCRDL